MIELGGDRRCRRRGRARRRSSGCRTRRCGSARCASRSRRCRPSRSATRPSFSWPSPSGSYAFEATSWTGPLGPPPAAAGVVVAHGEIEAERTADQSQADEQREPAARGAAGARVAAAARGWLGVVGGMIVVRSLSGSPRWSSTASSSATKSAIESKRSRGILGHRPPQRRVEAQRDVGPRGGDARDRVVDVLHRDRDEVLAAVRRLAGEQLVDDDAERVDVAERARPAARSPARARCSRSCRARSRSGSGPAGRRPSARSRSRSPSPRRCASSTFCGLTSRCTSPFSCAKASACPTSIASSSAGPHRQPPLASRRAASGSGRRRTRRR